MIVAYAYNSVYMCARISGRNSVKGGKNVKPGENRIFIKKGETVI